MSTKFFTIATIAAAAIVLVGCRKETASLIGGGDQLNPIAFTTYTQGATKADVTKAGLGTIYVLADSTGTSGTSAKYFNETIELSDSKGKSAAYWPATGTMVFYASNKQISDLGVVTVNSIDDDVVVAKTASISCPGSGDVSLTFSHIFAKFNVKAKVDTSELKAKITQIDLNVKSPTSYNIKAENDNWTLSDSATDVSYLTTAAEITATTATEVTLDKVYVAPQSSITARIKYQLTNSDGTVVYVDKSTTAAEISGLTFEEGKIYTLTLTFKASEISFSVSNVTDFAAGTDKESDL